MCSENRGERGNGYKKQVSGDPGSSDCERGAPETCFSQVAESFCPVKPAGQIAGQRP